MIQSIKMKARGIRSRLLKALTPSPVDAYGERTMMYVPQRDASHASSFLLDLATKVISRAREISLTELSSRQRHEPFEHPEIWPGEHYRLLAAIVSVMQPRTIVEIGTYRGMSALALKKFLPTNGTLTTFDIFPWQQITGTCLLPADFADGRLTQQIGDLSNPEVFEAHRAILSDADLIFSDAPKDGVFERKFLQLLSTLKSPSPKLLILDDIRTWNMLAIWREIDFPKLDLTSFGHWTGTGLIDWSGDAKN